ncbi:MAG: UDP-N-acetylmuramate--L-alanine ligase [Chloroflexi bacterium]|nr:UDP-N-acetylmuramate--L-alanine ligase [Chloroflexota bacterium]
MSRRVHVVGIGGAGMSAIARVLMERGEQVSGSDLAMTPFSEALAASGVPITIGHRAEAVVDADLVLASSAVPDSNVELEAASQRGIQVLRRPAFLPGLVEGYRTVAISGTHGKTTTTAMIAWILDRAGLQPSFIIGGIPMDLRTNSRHGSGETFVIEADEYDRAFLGLHPAIAVITNVEYDHPDSYPSFEAYKAAFETFVSGVQETVIVGLDDPVAGTLAPTALTRITFGLGDKAEWRAVEIRGNDAGGVDFLSIRRGETLGIVRLRLPGDHNVLNALGALATTHSLHVEFAAARTALADFHGVERRFEILGERAGVTVIDDYAHHPSAIRATLAATRQRYTSAQIWAVFQPHTYSRTAALFDQLTKSFADADHVIVTDIYAAREEPVPGVSAGELASQIEGPDVRFVPELEEVAKELVEHVKPNSVVVTLSAGNANRVGRLVLQELSQGGKHA